MKVRPLENRKTGKPGEPGKPDEPTPSEAPAGTPNPPESRAVVGFSGYSRSSGSLPYSVFSGGRLPGKPTLQGAP